MAKVATARKLLEWIYHILKGGRSFQEVKRWLKLWVKVSPLIRLTKSAFSGMTHCYFNHSIPHRSTKS